MAPPSYVRPQFVASDLSNISHPQMLKKEIQNAFRRYWSFVYQTIVPHQMGWVVSLRRSEDLGLTPYMNDPLCQWPESILDKVPVLYIYLPAENARQCALAQWLPPVRAINTKPYDTKTSIPSILEMYNRDQSNHVEEAHLKYFVAVAPTDWFGLNEQTGLYSRNAAGPFDVVAFGPALFREE
ncbi:RolB family protein [Bradyrhizobium sp. 142]|uniref:RolB family protein n=1 Tax=Bradyrhizobium sp. 142 TaxID=2782618 RepID=UPI001FFBECE5|nr:RolB family protein [Bradyrhizobium sp. 142]MCK1724545.1 hypothetical protein [Bradyrhizobium sp. 142]